MVSKDEWETLGLLCLASSITAIVAGLLPNNGAAWLAGLLMLGAMFCATKHKFGRNP